MKTVTHHICPVCGFDDLYEPAYDGDSGSLEICPSCGYQFGHTDDDSDISHEEWRQIWVQKGMPWDGIGIQPPANWNPKKMLQNIGIFLA